MIQATANDLLTDIGIEANNYSLNTLITGESRYVKDLRVNFKNVIKGKLLDAKEIALVGLSVATNNQHEGLQRFFTQKAEEAEATKAEIAEAVACASLLAANNIFYRFRHFTQKEKYNQLPAGIKMNIMMRPVTGKKFFELMSLAISAVNGCEMCVNAHEHSLLELGETEERIFEAVRLASVVVSATKIV